MKQTKLFVLAGLVAASAFMVVLYSSCKKKSCDGVICQNGGTCSKGSCSCPSGYTGNLCQSSSILFQNNTFTTINLVTNGSATTIPTGGSVVYGGAPGSVVSISATTYGVSNTGEATGETISWSLSDTMPSGGAGFTQPFNVSADYFYLQLINDDVTQYVNTLYVNYGSPLQTLENVSIPNDRNLYGIGYYRDSSNTQVYTVGSSGGTWSSSPTIPATINSSVVVKIN